MSHPPGYNDSRHGSRNPPSPYPQSPFPQSPYPQSPFDPGFTSMFSREPSADAPTPSYSVDHGSPAASYPHYAQTPQPFSPSAPSSPFPHPSRFSHPPPQHHQYQYPLHQQQQTSHYASPPHPSSYQHAFQVNMPALIPPVGVQAGNGKFRTSCEACYQAKESCSFASVAVITEACERCKLLGQNCIDANGTLWEVQALPASAPSRVQAACDNCRSKKSKCLGGSPCARCARLDVACTFNGAQASAAARQRERQEAYDRKHAPYPYQYALARRFFPTARRNGVLARVFA